MDYFIIAQFFGFLALISSFTSITQKNRNKYIVFNSLQNLFSGIQYFLLCKYVAMSLSLVSAIRLMVYSKKTNMSKSFAIFILIVFVMINCFISILSFSSWLDIIPFIASTIVCFTVWQNSIVIIKVGVIIAKLLWGIFAIFSLAYFAIIMDFLIVIWTLFILIKSIKIKN